MKTVIESYQDRVDAFSIEIDTIPEKDSLDIGRLHTTRHDLWILHNILEILQTEKICGMAVKVDFTIITHNDVLFSVEVSRDRPFVDVFIHADYLSQQQTEHILKGHVHIPTLLEWIRENAIMKEITWIEDRIKLLTRPSKCPVDIELEPPYTI